MSELRAPTAADALGLLLAAAILREAAKSHADVAHVANLDDEVIVMNREDGVALVLYRLADLLEEYAR